MSADLGAAGHHTGQQPVTVVLVRHGPLAPDGRCAGRHHDPPLAPSAGQRLTDLALRLPRPLGPVVCSPLGRATRTAELLGALSPTIDDRWAERDFGDLEGRAWEEVWDIVGPDALADAASWAAFTPAGGETFDQVAARVADALIEVTAVATGPPTVVVTHAGPIRLALRHALGLTPAQALAFDPAPATATWLTRWGAHWTVDRVGA